MSEEADCNLDTICNFKWTATLPTVTFVETLFDDTTMTWQYKVTGTDMTGDETNTELFVGGQKQPCLSVTSTEAIFTITNVSTSTFGPDNKLYFELGVPKDAKNSLNEVSVNPKFVSVSPTSGSPGGSLLTFNVPGVVKNQEVSIVDSADENICESVSVPSYGVIECETLAKEIQSTLLVIKSGTSSFECVNSDTSLCTYE